MGRFSCKLTCVQSAGDTSLEIGKVGGKGVHCDTHFIIVTESQSVLVDSNSEESVSTLSPNQCDKLRSLARN